MTGLLQNRKERRDNKNRIFGLLIAYRESVPLHREYVNALNLINVVFRGRRDQKVRTAWEELYQELHRRGDDYNAQEMQRKRHALLHAMGKRLGYETKGDVLAMYYVPQGHVSTNDMEWNLRQELLRVLRSTKSLNLLTDAPKEPKDGAPL